MSRRKRKKKDTGGGGGGWLTTFSDLMSLLLTFFILLFSMSNVSDDKFSAASQSIQDAFAGETGEGTILDGNGALENENSEDTEENQEDSPNEETENVVVIDEIPPEVLAMYEEALAFIESEGLESDVSVSGDQEGIYLDIQESILFETGQADITTSGEETLKIITELLNMTSNNIVVEGYTDNVPMNTPRFPSNWELSLGRAASVVRYLAEEENVEPTRLSAKGYGEFNPIVPNDSAENRAKNRRVNIIIVYQTEGENS